MVLGHRGRVNAPSAAAAADSAAAGGAADPPSQATAATLPHGELALPVVDLDPASLVSPKLASLLLEIKGRTRAGVLPASTQRYLWHLPALRGE